MSDDGVGGVNGHGFEFETRILADGFAYWRSKIENGLLPARPSIRPSEIPRLLPNIMLLDVIRAPEWDFCYRLIGTRIVEHMESDSTGMFVSAVEGGESPGAFRNACRLAAESGAPQFPKTPYVGPHDGFRRAEDLILPLADDGRTVDSLLVFIEYLPRA